MDKIQCKMQVASLGSRPEGNRSPEIWGLQSHEVSMGRLNLLTGKTGSTSCGKWFLFPFVKQVRKGSHLRPELGNLSVCTHPKTVWGGVYIQGVESWAGPRGFNDTHLCRSVQPPWWWSGPGPGASQLWKYLELWWPTAHWSSWPMWGALKWETPNIPSGAIMKLQDTLCTEAEMLFAPNDGIVVDEPNLQAQPQCPETLARLVGYEWGLHATN